MIAAANMVIVVPVRRIVVPDAKVDLALALLLLLLLLHLLHQEDSTKYTCAGIQLRKIHLQPNSKQWQPHPKSPPKT
jgi:hypothetical protein